MTDVLAGALTFAVLSMWLIYDRRAMRRSIESTWTMRAELTADDVQKVAYVLGKEGRHREQDRLMLTVQHLREWSRENEGLAMKRARERAALKDGAQ